MKGSKVLFIFVVVISFFVPMVLAAEYFNNGFEEGDFSAWTSTAGAPAVVASDANEGTYAMEVDTTSEMANQDIGGFTDNVYLRYYFKINSLPDANGETIRIGGWSRTGAYRLVTAFLTSDGSDALWQMEYRTNSAHTTATSTMMKNPSVNTYICVEVYYDAHASAGVAKMWIDGTELSDISVSNVANTYTGDLIALGPYTQLSPAATIHYDSVIAADAYIGPIAGGSTAFNRSVTLAINLFKVSPSVERHYTGYRLPTTGINIASSVDRVMEMTRGVTQSINSNQIRNQRLYSRSILNILHRINHHKISHIFQRTKPKPRHNHF